MTAARPRLYCRCPIAAAWLAKHLGVKYTNGDSLRSACEAIGSYGRDMKTSNGFFYLAPASARLLDSLAADQKAAMKLLGLWPESEAA